MQTTTYDQHRVCLCEHIKAHHTVDELWSCRMDSCECESFMPKPSAKIPADIPPANASSPETRLLRAIYGLCVECDHDASEHDQEADMDEHVCFACNTAAWRNGKGKAQT